jgi:hypothetical protein
MQSETVNAGAETPAQETIPVAPAPAKEGPINARDAMRSVVDWRRKSAAATERENVGAGLKPAPTHERDADVSADDATSKATESTAQAEDTVETRPESPPRETESADQEPEAPPIEPPRSWSKEDKELFRGLPRATQERLAERERSRDSDFSRRQQEATERAKALDAERGKVEQARAQYEQALPQLLETLQQQHAGEFSDIKTIADVEKLAREDWPRYLQWDLAQKKIAAVAQEMAAASQRQTQERARKFFEFARREDALFIDRAPEMADAEKAAKLQKQAVDTLKDFGFTDDELGAAWNGQRELSLRDHRLQLIIRDAILWRDAQAKAKAAATKPVPPVQRPSAAQDRSVSRVQQLESLNKGIDGKSGLSAIRAAAHFVAERRRTS